jgi:hypothetical protein
MPTLKRVSLFFVSFLLAASGYAAAQGSPNTISAPRNGVRNVLKMVIRSDTDAAISQKPSGDAANAKLTVKIRISAHSQESNFFGDVQATASDFDPAKGSTEQEVWRDDRCHHERGFPKTSVIDVDGAITNGQSKQPISARYRWIGLMLPEDEIIPAKRLNGGTDGFGPFIATRTETKLSRLLIDLRLYILPCTLAAGVN